MFRQLFIAQVKEFIRDTGGLFWTLAFPVLFTVIFGIVFSGSGASSLNITLGVTAPNPTPVTEQITARFNEQQNFNIHTGNQEEELKALQGGKRDAVLVLPALSYQNFIEQQQQQIELYYDDSQTQIKEIITLLMENIFSKIENHLRNQEQILTINSQAIQARQLSNFDYILPGILALSLMQLGLFGSLDFLKLREKKIIRGLGVTPLQRKTLLTSEILLRLVISLVQTFIIILLAQLLFDFTVVGSLIKILGIVLLGAATFISLGYMLISFVSTLKAGQGIVQIVQFPMMFLSGIFFPLEMMPEYIRPLVNILPLTYLGDLLRHTMAGTALAYSMTTNLIVLGGWLLGSFLLAIKFWKWE
jgi:ABC-2 type transport system permease protein